MQFWICIVWVFKSFKSSRMNCFIFLDFLDVRLINYRVQRLIIIFHESSWILGSLLPSWLNIMSQLVLILIYRLTLYLVRLNPLVTNLRLLLQIFVSHLPCLVSLYCDWGVLNFLWRNYRLRHFDLKHRKLFNTIKQLLHYS